ncbi:hypothetical protein DRO53_04805 [Candidatus Bathyarchaeota archaeon]|nr:MAG: hypothetical protein DRO53_04805 [Candidatus Bathyarchaeota archaeon]
MGGAEGLESFWEEVETTGSSQPFRRPGSFKDRDYLETFEGLVFCVVGEVHPPNRAFAYLKYVLSEGGARRVLRFYSGPHVEETMQMLEARYPEYLYDDEFSGLRFPAVPASKVKAHYKPEEKVKQIVEAPGDPLEAKASRLVRLLSESSGVPQASFGITGSILLGVHHPAYSDIDLTVYGLRESLRVREALENLYRERGEVRRLEGERLRRWCEEKARLHPLTLGEAGEIYRRTWSRGLYEETFFSIHPVRADWEVGEAYGDRRLKAEGIVEAEATILDASQSIFLPALYKIGEVKVLKGPQAREILELVSFEGLYSGIFGEGERVRVRGLLERVEKADGSVYRRILVGSRMAKGSDYIKPYPSRV